MNKTKDTRKSNGSGSIYYDEKRERWIGEIQWNDKKGEKHRKRFANKKQSVVKNKLKEFKRELAIANGNISSEDITFKEFADYWLSSVLKNKLKPTSYTRKEVTLINQVYPYIGNIPITQITHFDIQNMVNQLTDKELSYSTIKKAYEAVNGCIKEYRIKTATQFNPCEGISLPTNSQKSVSNITFFDEKQRNLIINEATRKYKTGRPVYRLGYVIIILMYTGMRIGELLALTWDDVNLINKTININKNAVIVKTTEDGNNHYKLSTQNSTKTKSSYRTIPMSQIAYNAFQEIQKITGNMDYVVSSANNKQINPRNINRMFHNILTQTGIAKDHSEFCGVHTLRHTFASMLFNNGCNVKVVSELLGHSDTKITENIYIHLIKEQKIKAIQDIDKYSN